MTDRVAYLGHATTMIEIDGVRMLTDPVLRGRVLHLRRYSPPVHEQDHSGIEAILLSHGHADHLDPPSLRMMGRDQRIIAPRGLGRALSSRGLGQVEEISVGESIGVGSLVIRATPAHHDGRRWPVGPAVPALGYIIEGGSTAYFAGDTDLFDEMNELGEIDLALLPVAGWGRSVGPGHLDPARAAEATAALRPRIVVPIHWGTLHFPPWRLEDARAPARKFKRLVGEGHSGAEVRVLEPGESTSITTEPVDSRGAQRRR